jgi:hypothetical protein
VELAIPIFLLAGGELFLAAIGLRIAVWVARGWREWRALARPGAPPGPRGPRGGLRGPRDGLRGRRDGLRPLAGGRDAGPRPLRAAA